jgi:hypothetical protein
MKNALLIQSSLNSADTFRGLAAKAKDIVIQCSEQISTSTLMNWETFKMWSDQ